MKLISGAFAVFLLLLFVFDSAHTQTSENELNLGVEAYKNSHYEEAIQHFRKATELDPANTRAHMYLATAYVSQYIPGVDTQDNQNLADRAIEQYQYVLNSDADQNSKTNSAKGVAYLYLNTKKFDAAKEYYQKAIGFEPTDPEPYYSIGVVDWTLCYQPRMEARARLGMRPEQNLNARIPAQAKVCHELSAENSHLIEEGMDSLNRAIELRPDYDDAMAYMNLMYRERADVECDDLPARARDLENADHWVDKTLEVKKAKASGQQPPPEQK